MATDFTSYSDSLVSPARSVRSVTPDNSNDLPDGVCKSLLVVTDGNVEIIAQSDASNQNITIAVTAGQILPIRVRRVREGTTATVVALY